MRKRRLLPTTVVAVLLALLLAATACSSDGNGSATGPTNTANTTTSTPSGPISVIAREDGSGTRQAFVELFGIEQNTGGTKTDLTTVDAVVTNSTAVMMTTVASDSRAIGYLSLGSLDSSVKALAIDGVDATTHNVSNGSYAIQRPFTIVTGGSLSAAAQDFIGFIMSSDGQAVIEGNHYVAVTATASAYKTNPNASGKVVVAGSSSVTPVMEKLKEAYIALNPSVTVEIQTSDSSTGVQSTIDGICDMGMASRDLKASERAAGLAPTVIALDGIAVIVSRDFALDGLTSAQVQGIYTGTITRWDEL